MWRSPSRVREVSCKKKTANLSLANRATTWEMTTNLAIAAADAAMASDKLPWLLLKSAEYLLWIVLTACQTSICSSSESARFSLQSSRK